jgi:phenylacetate-coenzyme A ligase PaaK-like adenylate-forming protein
MNNNIYSVNMQTMINCKSSYDSLLEYPPFSVVQAEKERLLHQALERAYQHHNECNPLFSRFCAKRGFSVGKWTRIEELPYLPVQLFKKIALTTTTPDKLVRQLHSSATSSQKPSLIALDQETRRRQGQTLAWLLADRLGEERLPFYVLDLPSTHESGRDLSARQAALRGFLLAASSVHPLSMQLLDHLSGPMVVLGYTEAIYSDLLLPLEKAGRTVSLSEAKLLHFGGWKKMKERAIGKREFQALAQKVLGISSDRVLDSYGFTEQLGIVYIDDSDGVKRTPLVSEIIIRHPKTLEPVADGEIGLIEMITPLPHSYPGMALLLDDLGRIVDRRPSKCGRHGTAFEVIGRAMGSEVRGCGDTR